jgi:hypothetical protein
MELLGVTLLIFHNDMRAKIKTRFRHYHSPAEQVARNLPNSAPFSLSLSLIHVNSKRTLYLFFWNVPYCILRYRISIGDVHAKVLYVTLLTTERHVTLVGIPTSH